MVFRFIITGKKNTFTNDDDPPSARAQDPKRPGGGKVDFGSGICCGKQTRLESSGTNFDGFEKRRFEFDRAY